MHSETLRCGLLGRTLSHSYSPAIHAQLAGYSYLLYEKEPEELEGFLRSGEFDGLNVTIPYKKTVIPYCAELSDTARAIGAVNTIVRRPDGTLWGDNTDAYGFSILVRASGTEVRGKKALVFGSGGASATAQYVLRQMGAREVVVISRHGEDNYENLGRHADAQIAVNTTPVGMYPNTGVSPVDLSRFPKLEAALDVIYNPARTEFLLQAEQLGLKRANRAGKEKLRGVPRRTDCRRTHCRDHKIAGRADAERGSHRYAGQRQDDDRHAAGRAAGPHVPGRGHRTRAEGRDEYPGDFSA